MLPSPSGARASVDVNAGVSYPDSHRAPSRCSWFTMKRSEPNVPPVEAFDISWGNSSFEPDEPGAMRARLVKLAVTDSWKRRLREWMETSRWTYNQCVALVKNGECVSEKGCPQLGELRDRVVNNNRHGGIKKKGAGKKPTKRTRREAKRPKKERHPRPTKTEWVLNTPYEIRSEAAGDLKDAFTSNVEKKNKDPSHEWNYKFRSKKARLQTIKIPHKCIGSGGIIFPTFSNKEPLKSFEGPVQSDGELQIHLDRMGVFWATELRRTVPVAFDPEKKDIKICALDPGVRTFNTVFDNQGIVTEMAPKDVGRIYRLCAHADKLQCRIVEKPEQGMRSKKRCRLRKAWLRLLQRIRFLVKDCHRKCAKYLCSGYDVVFIPDFNSKSMTEKSRGYRRMTNKVARALMNWSHYTFRQVLKAKAAETGTKVVVMTEEYTTVTCGHCGHVRSKFGGKTFCCPQCGMTCDRDVNGARNILIKAIMENDIVIGSAPLRGLGDLPPSLGSAMERL